METVSITDIEIPRCEVLELRLAEGSRIAGISHNLPCPHLRVEQPIDAPRDVVRTFLLTGFQDEHPTGWSHIATTLMGGEKPGDTWETVHLWERPYLQ